MSTVPDHPRPPAGLRDRPGLMTNLAAGMSAEALTHELTLRRAAASARDLAADRLAIALVASLGTSRYEPAAPLPGRPWRRA